MHAARSNLVSALRSRLDWLFDANPDLALQQASNVLNDEQARAPVSPRLVLILATVRDGM